MNQILYTGGKNKNRGTTDTRKVITVSMAFIIVFAICLIGVGINLLSKVKTGNNNNNTIGNNVETPGTVPEKPVESNIEIDFASQVNSIKATIVSNKKIDQIIYWWDEEEPISIEPEESGFGNEYEAVIESRPGTHQLSLTITDEDGYEESIVQEVIGRVVDDTVPELTIGTDGVSKYVIKAKDDEEITKIVIVLNEEIQEIQVNKKEVQYEVDIPEGDSLIEVTVYNLNDLSVNKSAIIRNFRTQ